MTRRIDEHQAIFDFAFTARKPKRGAFLVCQRRGLVYGQVLTIRPDKSFKRTGPHGVVVDSRKSGTTWETIQYDPTGEYRFLEVVPPEFVPVEARASRR